MAGLLLKVLIISNTNELVMVKPELLWVVAFDVGLNQRGMRERTLSIVNIRIGVVVEQNHRFILRDDTDGRYKFLEFVLQHPFITGQVDQLARCKIAQQLLAMNALAMSEAMTELTFGTFHVLHVTF